MSEEKKIMFEDKSVVEGSGQWSTPLFGCFSHIKICALGMLCPCIVVGKTAEALGEDFRFHCITGMCFPYNIAMRYRIRKDKDIRGTMCHDMCMESFCAPCALCQDAREMGIWAKENKVEDQAMARE